MALSDESDSSDEEVDAVDRTSPCQVATPAWSTHRGRLATLYLAVIRKINPTMLYTHLQDLVKTPHQSELDNYAIAIEQFRSSWFLSPAAPFLHKGIQMDVTIERTCLVVHMFDSKADGFAPINKSRSRQVKHTQGRPRTFEAKQQSEKTHAGPDDAVADQMDAAVELSRLEALVRTAETTDAEGRRTAESSLVQGSGQGAGIGKGESSAREVVNTTADATTRTLHEDPHLPQEALITGVAGRETTAALKMQQSIEEKKAKRKAKKDPKAGALQAHRDESSGTRMKTSTSSLRSRRLTGFVTTTRKNPPFTRSLVKSRRSIAKLRL
ncbi:hypothetical protein N0V86_009638 [Didymella sp. IMI 355093]|nr:hypothetical protein N0V86_009638 [Didymella sp. IMI 355093]